MLSRAVGSQATFLATVFGETWDAEQAFAYGLVAKTFADNDALLTGARELAARLNSQSVPYVRRVVQTARSAMQTLTHDQALAAETDAQRWSTTQQEFLDGVASIEGGIATRRAR
jgi:enoyl-CoA hydratase/carnithine racemase